MSNMNKVYGKSKENYTAKIKRKEWTVFIICVILSVICLLPMYILFINATRDSAKIASSISFIPGGSLAKNIKTLFKDVNYSTVYNVLIGYRNSLFITAFCTIFTVFFSTMTAYGLHVYTFKLRNAAYTMILAVMMVPMQVTSAGFVAFMLKIGLTDTYWPLILPAIAAPTVVYFMTAAMKDNGIPLSIVEAARIDGCGEFRTFISIALPMMRTSIAVQSIFAFIASWNNFYTPNMILISSKFNQKTLPMMISAIQASDKFTDYGAIYLALSLSIIPLIIVYAFFSRQIVGGLAEGGVKE